MKIEDLDPDTLKKLGLTVPRTRAFKAEDERRHAIRVLHAIVSLDQGQRARVLRRALKLNEV